MSTTPRLMTGPEEKQFNALEGSIFCEFEVGPFKFRSEWCDTTVNIWYQDDDGEWCTDEWNSFTNISLRGSPDGHKLAALSAAALIREEARKREEEWA